jgi:hypothetical protein
MNINGLHSITPYVIVKKTSEKLGFPHYTFYTALTLYNKFKLNTKETSFNATNIAITCLFIASKAEETIKKLKDILIACWPLIFPDSPLVDYDHPVLSILT